MTMELPDLKADSGLITTRLEPADCPACGKCIDAVSGTGVPTVGELTLCCYCRAWQIFDRGLHGERLRIRMLTDAEWLALPNEDRVFFTRIRDHWKEWR